MRRRESVRWLRWVGVCLALALCLPAAAQKVKDRRSVLDDLVSGRPELRVAAQNVDLNDLRGTQSKTADQMAATADAFMSQAGGAWVVMVDRVTGRPSLMEGRGIPWIPGTANSLRAEELGFAEGAVPVDYVAGKALELMAAYPDLFGVNLQDLRLNEAASGPIGDYLYFVDFDWTYAGVPVENAHITFRLNHGNLVQMGQENIAASIDRLDPVPTLTEETAWEILYGFLGPLQAKDEVLGHARLVIMPMLTAQAYAGAAVEPGTGMEYRLAYTLAFHRPGVMGNWEARVDAHTGEVLSFRDTNDYGSVHGGVYPGDRPAAEVDRPFPYADVGGGLFADAGGIFAGNNATSALNGQYVKIADQTCNGGGAGTISLSTTTGDLDFGMSAGRDCVTPGFGGTGNTHAARTQYYQVNLIKMKARSYLPTNTWLQGQLTDNVNINDVCNAYWSSVSGTVNFFKYGVYGSWTCENTGELPGVSLHEWGHGMDYNDGLAPADKGTGETYGDFTAVLQTHNSCAGNGFFIGANCSGYGDPCLNCSGIRDINYAAHTSNTPAVPTMLSGSTGFHCSTSGSYYGPCGYEGHCESYISSEALWDLATRDLVTWGLDLNTAWLHVDKLWYKSRPTAGSAYACPSLATSNGCGAANAFSVFRVIDDDDGDLSNGTPHASAIYAAFNRHAIACSTVVNTDSTGCPSFTTPVLAGTAGNNQILLSWGAVAGAVTYDVYRNESSCDAGFTRLGSTASTSYTDSTAINGLTYYYRVQAIGTTAACFSAMSNCFTGTPQPCAGSVSLDKTVFNCADTVNVAVLDSTPGAGPWTVEAWSTTDATHKVITLANDPPGSATYTGSFTTTTSATPSATEVRVADGDTITVQYTDPDYCGGGSQAVTTTASVDCSGPVISAVQAINVTGNSATITWTTNENANSRVTHGTSIPPGTNTDDLVNYVTSHSILVSGLVPCTTYFYSVTSTDAAGNATTSNNGGAYYVFTTGVNVNPTYTKVESPPLAITDLTTVYSDIAVPDDKAIQKVVVTIIQLNHTWDSDLDIYLQHPDGTLVELTTDNGSSGDNYIATVFDDDAATSITSGTAPFTGTYRPEGSLAALNGKSALGTWRLRIYDDTGGDTGTLTSWSLTLLYPAQSCGAAAEYQSSDIQDVCAMGGPGNGDEIIDPGDTITLPVTIHNSGTGTLTGVTGELSTANPNVTILQPTTTFPDVPYDGTAVSVAPHVSFTLADSGWTCGDTIDFTFSISSNEGGPWDTPFTLTVGQVIAGGTTYLINEPFTSTTLPAGWSVQTLSGNPWTMSASYFCSASYGIVYNYHSTQVADSWFYTSGQALTAGVTYTVAFNQRVQSATYPENLSVWAGTSASNGSMTIPVWSQTGLVNTACTARTATFTVPATGTYYLGFHCTSAANMWRLYVDDVQLSYTQTDSCTMNACVASCPTITVSPATLPNGTAGSAYSQTITASGGTGPYTYAVTAGALPGGMNLSAGGVLSGTPSAAATYNFTVTATDANTCTGSLAYALVIDPGSCPTITISPATLTNATVGTSYSQTLTAAGGTAPYTYAVTAGSLPAGLSLSAAGVLSGTPTASGSSSFTVTATDANTCTGTRAYTLQVDCPAITVSPATLPDATVGTAYSQTLTAAGGTSPYTYAVTAGSLPAGLTLSAGGVLSGTPTAGGSSTFTVTATGTYGCTGSRAYTLQVNCPTITVNPATLPDGVVGTAYNQTITATGGTSPYTYAVTAGSLPAGLTLSAAGVLSGTPTTASAYSFTVTATGTYACTGSRAYTVTITDPLVPSASADVYTGSAPLTVNFTGSATGAGGGPYTYSWDFGDGSPLSTAQNPSHTFAEGTYTVTLTVTAGVQNASTSMIIEVYGINFRTFLDDGGRSKLCVDRITGAYTFMITSGPYSGLSATGMLQVRNGGTLFMSATGSTYYVYCSYDPIRKRASGYFYDFVTHAYAQLSDSNTTDNPMGCAAVATFR